MQINPTINLNGVPLAQQPGFTAAVNAACSFYDQLFSNNVTLNVTFTYGPVSGGSAQNTAQGIYTNYATIRSELASNADTAVADTAVNTLSATDPTGGGTFFLTEAQAKALGMGSQLSHWGSVYGSPGNASAADGVVTLNSSVTWDYGTSGRAAPSQLDAIGALEHEISEVMGRNGIEGTGNLVYNQNNDTYTALDLFRYVQNASGGLTQTLAPGPGTFSFDGRTPTLTFNDPTILNSSGSPQGGDLTDWASFNPNQGGPVGDSYGQPLIDAANTVSQTDLEVMNVIGWQIVTPTVAQLQSLYAANPTSMELSVVDSAANVSSNFDALVSLAQNGAFNSISFTDLVPVLSLDNYQLTSDASLFPLIQGKYELSDKLSDIPLTFSLPSNVPYITLTGSGDATITGNALNDTYVVNAQGNHTIDPGDLGSDTIVSNAGTTTLDYTSVAAGLIVDVPNGEVDKPGGIWIDTFNSEVQDFIGSGSGSTTFRGASTGDDTFTGNGAKNTLDYSENTDAVTIDLGNDTVTKDLATIRPLTWWQDSFSDIQTFVGGGSGNNTFEGIATGGYTFTGRGVGNTLSYSQDNDGVTIDLTTDTATKDLLALRPLMWWQDSFSDIQTFVGGGSGGTTFKGIATGDYTFTGQDAGNTLSYAADTDGVTINLASDTVSKDLATVRPLSWWQDSFSDIQTIDGSTGGDTLLDGAGAGLSFVGSGGNNSAVFNGQRSEYTVALSTDSNGVQHVTVADIGTTGDATLDLVDVQSLQFAGGTTVATSSLSSAPPVVTPVSSNISASNGQSFAASSLFTASDPAGNPFTQYTFWDTGSGGGHFVLNGVAQSTNQAINISAAQLSQLTYQSGSGADTLWVKASDGVQSSAWSSAFTVTAPVDSGPVEGVSNLTAPAGQWLTASSLFTYSDPFGSAATQYGFWNSGTGGGHFELPGIALPTNQEDIINAAQLSELYYVAGSGTDTLWVQANDGTVWGAWSSSFSVSLPVDTGPLVSVANLTATHGESFNASSLFTYSDPIGAAATEYDVWNAGTGGGHFVLGNVLGTTLPANQDNIITAAQLSQLSYQSGSGTDTLWVRANDGAMWGNWSQAFTVTAPVDSGPVVTPINANISSFTGQTLNVGSLFTESNPVSAATEYDVWSGSGGGQLLFNGTALPANQDNIVSALQLDFGELTYQVGNGSGELWIRANDGTVWGAWSPAITVTGAVDTPVVSVTNQWTVSLAQTFAASTLFTATDPAGTALTEYAFWDTGSGGAHFVLNGVAQSTNQAIEVTAAQLSQLTYQSGSGADTLWVQAYNGTQWSAWSNAFTVTGPIDSGPVETVSNLTATHDQNFAASSLFSYSDPYGNAATEYDFWDAGTGGGHFVLGSIPALGTALPANQDNIVSAAQLANLTYEAGSGADTLWVRANDGTTWGAWSPAFTVTAPVDTGPVVTPTNADISSFAGQTFNANSMIAYSDPFGSTATEYDVWNAGTGGGEFLFKGTPLPANQDNIIPAWQVWGGDVSYKVGSGSDTLWVKANDGTTWGAWSQGFTVADPPAVAAGQTITLGSAYAGEVDFLADTGTLTLENSSTFAGTVAGLHGQDAIDFADIGFGAHSTLGYSGNSDNSGGTLSVGDGTHVASVALLGSYMASTFVAASDGHGGTLISQAAQAPVPTLTLAQTHA